jgi:hypothetical protein
MADMKAYNDLLAASNAQVMQQAAALSAELARQHQEWQVEVRKVEAARRVAKAAQLEDEMHDALRNPVQVRGLDQGSYLHDLISKAVYKAIDYGCPRYCMPVFVVDGELFQKADRPKAPAVYNLDEGDIYVNPNAPDLKDPNGLFLDEMPSLNMGQWSTDFGGLHAIVHEIGHRFHAVALGPDQDRPLEHPDFLKVAKTVGKYASTDPREFVAEVFAGLVLGMHFTVDVMTMYRHFAGWEPMPGKDLLTFAKNDVPTGWTQTVKKRPDGGLEYNFVRSAPAKGDANKETQP